MRRQASPYSGLSGLRQKKRRRENETRGIEVVRGRAPREEPSPQDDAPLRVSLLERAEKRRER